MFLGLSCAAAAAPRAGAWQRGALCACERELRRIPPKVPMPVPRRPLWAGVGASFVARPLYLSPSPAAAGSMVARCRCCSTAWSAARRAAAMYGAERTFPLPLIFGVLVAPFVFDVHGRPSGPPSRAASGRDSHSAARLPHSAPPPTHAPPPSPSSLRAVSRVRSRCSRRSKREAARASGWTRTPTELSPALARPQTGLPRELLLSRLARAGSGAAEPRIHQKKNYSTEVPHIRMLKGFVGFRGHNISRPLAGPPWRGGRDTKPCK